MILIKKNTDFKWFLYDTAVRKYSKISSNDSIMLTKYFSKETNENFFLKDDFQKFINSFIKKKEYKIIPVATPIKCFFSLTNNCNIKCLHCFTDSGQENENELNKDQIVSLIKEMSELGIMNISLTGGEPLLKQDFFEIVNSLNEENMSISITTNGTLLTFDNINKLFKSKIKSITISLDSFKKNSIRIGCNIDELITNIKMLTKYILENNIKTNVSLRVSLNKYNFNELNDIYEFCIANNISKLKINNTNPLGRAKAIKAKLLAEKEFRDIIHEFYEKNKPYSNICEIEIPIEKYIAEDSKLTNCSSGIATFNILEDGSVVPCGFFKKQLLLGDLNSSLLTNIFKDYHFSYNNKVCKICKMNDYKDVSSITKKDIAY